MAEYDIGQTSRTDLTSTVTNFNIDSVSPDRVMSGETVWDFPDADQNLGYYKSVPELKKAIDALAMWTTGRGYEADEKTKLTLGILRGWGEDNFLTIVRNLLVQKKVFGDCFAEIIRGKNGRLLNLKPLYPGDMRIVVDDEGIISHYEQRVGKDTMKLKVEQIFHSSNDRIANEIHGTSVIECVKWIIDAMNEAMRDHRQVIHRNLIPVRIIEVDTEDTAKRDLLIAEYENAIKKGEVLVIPKGTVEMKNETVQIQDPIKWISYLENRFYLAVGVPRVVLGGSSDHTEAASKVDYLTFEEVYNREHEEFESDFLNQIGLTIKFNKPASLQEPLASSEEKNTGQVGFQQNDTEVKASRQ